jgi:hypothetical protein
MQCLTMKRQMTWLEGVSFFPLRLNLHISS